MLLQEDSRLIRGSSLISQEKYAFVAISPLPLIPYPRIEQNSICFQEISLLPYSPEVLTAFFCSVCSSVSIMTTMLCHTCAFHALSLVESEFKGVVG